MRRREAFTMVALTLVLTAPLPACARTNTQTTDASTTVAAAPATTERQARKKTSTTGSSDDVGTTTTRARSTTIPPGAEPVGHGTYVRVPDGWELERKDDTLLYLNRGPVSRRFETVEDTGAHDPQEWFYGYVNDHQNETGFSITTAHRIPLLDSDSTDTVLYRWTASGIRDDTKFHSDQVLLWVRADGLVALHISDFSELNLPEAVPADTLNGFESTIIAAPELGQSKPGPAPATLDTYDDPNLNQLDGGFRVVTLPGWTRSESTPTTLAQKNADASVVVTSIPSGQSEQQLTATAEADLRALYSPGLTITKRDKDSKLIPSEFTSTPDVKRLAFDFQGTYSPTDPRPIHGDVDLIIRPDGSAARLVKTAFSTAAAPQALFDAALYSLLTSA